MDHLPARFQLSSFRIGYALASPGHERELDSVLTEMWPQTYARRTKIICSAVIVLLVEGVFHESQNPKTLTLQTGIEINQAVAVNLVWI